MSAIRFLKTLSIVIGVGVVLVACEGGELPTRGPTQTDSGPTGWADSGGSPAADQGGWLPPSADMSPPPPTVDGAPSSSSCPTVDGDWSGTLAGNINSAGLINLVVNGTLALTLTPQGTAGDYIVSTGQMVASAKGFEAFPFKYAVNGSVKCGVLTATNTVDIFGVKSTGTVTCTFTDQGCKGTWDGQSTDGASKGSGTFEVHR